MNVRPMRSHCKFKRDRGRQSLHRRFSSSSLIRVFAGFFHLAGKVWVCVFYRNQCAQGRDWRVLLGGTEPVPHQQVRRAPTPLLPRGQPPSPASRTLMNAVRLNFIHKFLVFYSHFQTPVSSRKLLECRPSKFHPSMSLAFHHLNLVFVHLAIFKRPSRARNSMDAFPRNFTHLCLLSSTILIIRGSQEPAVRPGPYWVLSSERTPRCTG